MQLKHRPTKRARVDLRSLGQGVPSQVALRSPTICPGRSGKSCALQAVLAKRYSSECSCSPSIQKEADARLWAGCAKCAHAPCDATGPSSAKSRPNKFVEPQDACLRLLNDEGEF